MNEDLAEHIFMIGCAFLLGTVFYMTLVCVPFYFKTKSSFWIWSVFIPFLIGLILIIISAKDVEPHGYGPTF